MLRGRGTRFVTLTSILIPSAAKRINNGFLVRQLSRFSSSNKTRVQATQGDKTVHDLYVGGLNKYK
jgi:hypothetical protein